MCPYIESVILILNTRYYGTYSIEGMKDGLLLGDANYGDLQSCIDGRDYGEIDDALRTKWSLQIAEAVAYIHEKGIIHSNLSTTNVLVHRTGQTTDLILADFGGSRCLELDLDGELLSDDPFMDPQLANLKLPKLDVFSLGVVIYIIMTDQYPFHQGPAPLAEERFIYGDRVLKLFDEGKFSTLSSVKFGSVIAGCYSERLFETTKEVVNVLEAEMRCHAS